MLTRWVEPILDHARDRAPTLGTGRLICIDGYAASGKTTLAELLARQSGATLVHTDDLLEGWDGLPALGTTIDRLLRPLALSAAATARHWDWHTGQWSHTTRVEPCDLLILEGVGSAPPECHALVTTLVFVEATRSTRLERGLERDGVELRPQWLRWLDAEESLHTSSGARARAHFRIDTT